MPNQPDKLLSEVIELASKNQDIDVLWLYGSRARGDHTDTSDYDLAVAFNTFSLSPYDRALRPELLAIDWRLQLHLSETQLSVVDINLIPIPLALNVIEADHPLLINDDLRFLRERGRIWALWADIKERQSHDIE